MNWGQGHHDTGNGHHERQAACFLDTRYGSNPDSLSKMLYHILSTNRDIDGERAHSLHRLQCGHQGDREMGDVAKADDLSSTLATM